MQDKVSADSKSEVVRLVHGGAVPELELGSNAAAQAKTTETSFQTLAFSIEGR